MTSTGPAYATRLPDLRLEIRVFILGSTVTALLVGAVAHFADGSSPLLTVFCALLVPLYLGWSLAGDYVGRWTQVDYATFELDSTTVAPAFFPGKNHHRIHLHTGGKNARRAYRRFLLDALSKGVDPAEVLDVARHFPPSDDVRTLVIEDRVTDPEVIEGVLAGKIPAEWAKAYSSAQSDEAA